MNIQEEEIHRRQKIQLRPSEFYDLLKNGVVRSEDVEIFISEEEYLMVIEELDQLAEQE